MAGINATEGLVNQAIAAFGRASWGIANHRSVVEELGRNNGLHAQLPDIAQRAAGHVTEGIRLLTRAGLTDESDAVSGARTAAEQLKLLSRPTDHPSGQLPALLAAKQTIDQVVIDSRPHASFMVRVRPDYG